MKDTTRDSGSIEPSEKPLETLFVVGALELRDYFAAKAMLGLFMQWGVQQKPILADERKAKMANFAYELADAMLAERKEQR